MTIFCENKLETFKFQATSASVTQLLDRGFLFFKKQQPNIAQKRNLNMQLAKQEQIKTL